MNVRDALGAAVDALAAAGCDTPRLDAELLIGDALGISRATVISDPSTPIPPPAARVIGDRIRRRVQREPVAYILGTQAFRRLDLAVDPRVLIPRPETELLVDIAAEMPDGARVHDVGTGSGAIALAIKDERPELSVTASDASAAAVEVARANAARLRLDVEFTVERGLPATMAAPPPDLVVANLPYVREDEWGALQPEIRRYEPRGALVAGRDGLDAIRELIAGVPAGTLLALEHAPAQAAAVRDLLVDVRTIEDLAGRERVTLGSPRESGADQ